jgi:hypothetical protein
MIIPDNPTTWLGMPGPGEPGDIEFNVRMNSGVHVDDSHGADYPMPTEIIQFEEEEYLAAQRQREWMELHSREGDMEALYAML